MRVLRSAGSSTPTWCHCTEGASNGSGSRPLTAPVSVAVVIPAHNEEATIRATVRSCLDQTHPVDQLIVVADNCTDNTPGRARRAGAVVLEGNGGSKAAAQNLALPHVTSDVLLAIDGDATLNPPAVELMVDTLLAGAAGTCPSALPGDTSSIYSQYRTLYHAIANGWVRRMQDVLGRQLVLSGMANCHRTDVLRELGGYPEDNITEDFNLTWMLHRHGHGVAFTPAAIVYTQEPTSLRELLSQMHRWTSGFAQTIVRQRTPLLDGASFVVVVSQLTDAVLGGLATCSFLPFVLRHGAAGVWRWWSALWGLVLVGSVGVAVRQVGVRTTAKCFPGWFVLQVITGPVGAWWLFRESVLGRHLTTWTGRHGCKAQITPMSARRKVVLLAGAVLGGSAALAASGPTRRAALRSTCRHAGELIVEAPLRTKLPRGFRKLLGG